MLSSQTLLRAALTLAASCSVSATATVPTGTVRGVNLGGWLISEPWMMHTSWEQMGCAGSESEFDCMLRNPSAQEGFTEHYDTYITQDDFTRIKQAGLNTVRIPIGYWTVESLVDSSEHFPTGSFTFLRRAARWARDAGLNVVLVLHGAPGAQKSGDAFTGQLAPNGPGFYSSYNYERAYEWARNLTTEVHRDPASFGTVFAIEAVNEPVSGQSTLVSEYYPGFLNAVRDTEEALGITCDSKTAHAGSTSYHGRPSESASGHRSGSGRRKGPRSLHTRANFEGCLNVQFMDKNWGAGEPTSSLPNLSNVLFDSHIYLKYRNLPTTRAGYLAEACKGLTAQEDSPVIVGEWSLSPAGDNEHAELSTQSEGAAEFYQQYFGALVQGFEQQGKGWIFWSWKTTGLNDPRWDYQLALEACYIPSDASAWSRSACDSY